MLLNVAPLAVLFVFASLYHNCMIPHPVLLLILPSPVPLALVLYCETPLHSNRLPVESCC